MQDQTCVPLAVGWRLKPLHHPLIHKCNLFSPVETLTHTHSLYQTGLCFIFHQTFLLVSCSCSAAGGEIFDHCVSDELLPEAQITRLIRQTLEGVHYLHQSNLVHLDLKVFRHIQPK